MSEEFRGVRSFYFFILRTVVRLFYLAAVHCVSRFFYFSFTLFNVVTRPFELDVLLLDERCQGNVTLKKSTQSRRGILAAPAGVS
ncbi:hypothetical protein NDU88_001062 [Pleurodeles waltl]|uniref:Secreted protein n=1 Tax=Pleurodeles waltl TaxID=8319 RepID=A0AAV7VXY7_PLEWA|nr:hypothetical protein NDU88_001062 [Pleurodeles waltl]